MADPYGPGYSAKYGSYTLMDLHSKKILDFQLVQGAGGKHLNVHVLEHL
jgi:hypothetical protein